MFGISVLVFFLLWFSVFGELFSAPRVLFFNYFQFSIFDLIISVVVVVVVVVFLASILSAPQSHKWENNTEIVSTLSPKRDWGPKRANN